MKLRPYQSEMLTDITMEFAAGSRAVLAVLPTGGGKTVIFTDLAQQFTSGPVAIVAHRRELVRQAASKLGATPHGLIMPGRPLVRFHRIQVGSIQSMTRQLPHLPRFGLIILDEAHHAVAGLWKRLLESQPDALVLGVTATPARLDGRGLGRDAGGPFDTLVTGPTVADLVAAGYLAPARVYRPPTQADLAGIRMIGGDFNAGQLAEAMDRPSITGDAVTHYARHAPGQPAIAFCASVGHAEHVAQQFTAAGWRSVCVHGGLDPAVRDARIAGLATGAVQVLTSCDLISEGLDVPAVGAVIGLRPTKSEAMHLQMIGRGMRPSPGKDFLVVLDHAGNTATHGLPDAVREWTLDGRVKREKNAPDVASCPECYAAHAPAPRCPACGFEYTATKAERADATLPEQLDGDLVEVTGATAALPPLKEALKDARTREDVEAIRIERGYAPAWTNRTMRFLPRGGRGRWTSAAEDFGVAP